MKLRFLGTRGYIDARTRRHRMHTSLSVSYRGAAVMVDCGLDWVKRVHRLRPDAIVLTHAHPDHAFGLRDGARCPVYATEDTWQGIDGYPIRNRHVVRPYRRTVIRGITFEAFPVEHSIRAPAVGYRIEAGTARVFYVPDLVYIYERARALDGIALYIGDGATLTRPLVRRRGDTLIGHTPVRTQLTWCQKESVPHAIITHCGAGIVEGDERVIGAQVREMAVEREVRAWIAHDGMEVEVRGERVRVV